MNNTGGINGKLFPIANSNNEEDKQEYDKFAEFLKQNGFGEELTVQNSGLIYFFIKYEYLETFIQLSTQYNERKEKI
jgi:arginyl-tRNA synthetase